jgi:SAM-dependent methyltransferase
MNPLGLLKTGARMVRWRELRATIAYCPICDARRPFVRLQAYEMAARCLACRASAVSLSIVSVLRKLVPDIGSKDVYELSSGGPLFRYLKTHARALTFSEYFEDVAPGQFRNGVQCQDVQRLTHASASFDICTSTEVFEHVPDDATAFAEMFRVLRADVTPPGEVRHLLPPEYHGDRLRASAPILAFRTYGRDIVRRLTDTGFSDARILLPQDRIPWSLARPVVVASRGATK